MMSTRTLCTALLFAIATATAHCQVPLVSAAAPVPDSVKPLTELGSGLYRGYSGGLYPGGANMPPAAHLAAGLAIARSVVPLGRTGTPDPAQGSIVLLSIGMSNTTQEFSTFKPMADTFARRNPRLVVVDGAQGGQTASTIANPAAAFWTVIDQRLQAAGVTPAQVEVVWLKEANGNPTSGFPQAALDLERDLGTIVRYLPVRYPNIKMVYLSSRIYGGYATTTLNPEMYAYEGGFSVKWLVEQQINGDTALAFAGAARRAPWLAWGPYLWANGLRPRADGLIWQQGDFVSDGTHPSTTGRLKVAAQLLDFLATDTTASLWFLKPQGNAGITEHANVDCAVECIPNPIRSGATIRLHIPAAGNVKLVLADENGAVIADLAQGPMEAGAHAIDIDPASGCWATLASGRYFLMLRYGGGVGITPIVLMR